MGTVMMYRANTTCGLSGVAWRVVSAPKGGRGLTTTMMRSTNKHTHALTHESTRLEKMHANRGQFAAPINCFNNNKNDRASSTINITIGTMAAYVPYGCVHRALFPNSSMPCSSLYGRALALHFAFRNRSTSIAAALSPPRHTIRPNCQ